MNARQHVPVLILAEPDEALLLGVFVMTHDDAGIHPFRRLWNSSTTLDRSLWLPCPALPVVQTYKSPSAPCRKWHWQSKRGQLSIWNALEVLHASCMGWQFQSCSNSFSLPSATFLNNDRGMMWSRLGLCPGAISLPQPPR